MQIASVNGIKIHYSVEGRAQAPALVFSNSLGTDFRVWDRVAALLSDRFQIIRYDNRGHGLSSAPSAPYTIEDHRDDLIGLLEYLNPGPAVLCGLSVGGMIVQSVGATRADLVRALVLSDTAHKIGPASMWNERIDAIGEQGIDTFADGILERWFTEDFRKNKRLELAGWRAMLTRTPLEGYLGTCAALRDADLTAGTSALTMPVLCICGAEDAATTPEVVEELSELIANSRFEQVAGAGHFPCVEQPDYTAGLITRFLEENSINR